MRTAIPIRIMWVCLCLGAGVVSLRAESRSSDLLRQGGLAENNLVRADRAGEMVKPVRQITDRREYFSFPGGASRVLFKTVVKKDHVFFLFLNETRNGYAEWGPGHYFIKRHRTTGKFVSIFVPYRDDDGCYLEILPRGNQTILNVFLFGRKVHEGLPLSLSLETLVTAPLADVIDMTRGTVDWPVLFFRGGRPEDRLLADTVAAIRRELPLVREAADGALDAAGRYVAIHDGRPLGSRGGFNCSGFVKWIVDGLYQPLTGELTDIGRLKTRPLDRRGTRWSAREDEIRDPYFGLDWTRNLATALAGAQSGGEEPDYESADVRDVPFVRYREDAGYPAADLEAVLFHLAVTEPGTFYLGSVNDISRVAAQHVAHFHVAAFFPFFDESGRFRVVVMDQHKNPSLEAFRASYARRDIHLVRIRLGGDFSLFHIE